MTRVKLLFLFEDDPAHVPVSNAVPLRACPVFAARSSLHLTCVPK